MKALQQDKLCLLFLKKQFFLFTFLSFISIAMWSQSITELEYFFGTDPGFGNGTTLSVTNNTGELIQSFSLPITGLNEGFQQLNIRSLDDQGTWGLYQKVIFYVAELASEAGVIANISNAEYWFDTDPGLGNGIALTISGTPTEATESFVIPLGNLEQGFHSLGLRTQNTDGTWSLYDKKVFYIFDNEEFDASPLTEIEFLFDEELGYGTGQTAPIIATGNPNEYLVEIPTDLVSCDVHDIWISVKNEAGKYSQYSILVDVDVFDNENPTIVVFPDITVELDANGTGSLTLADVDNGTFDDCELVSVELNQEQFNYNCDNLGNNTVTITATDAEAKVTTQDVTVTVVDNINPIAIAQNITIALDENGIANITGDDLDNGSTDNCNIVSRTVNISNFTCDNLGENTVTFTVEDAGGNTNSVEVIVTVIDDLSPIASAQDISIQLDDNGLTTLTINDIDTSTDNCAIATTSIDLTSFDCSSLGANTVTLNVTDTSGNSSSTTAVVAVEDNINPVAVAQNITVQLDENGIATISATDLENGSTDNCGIANRSVDISSFTCENLGANTVSFTVEDTSGNSNSLEVIVTVEDNSSPVAVAQSITVQLDGNGLATITANDLDNGSSDNCGISNRSIDLTNFSCDDIGSNTVTLMVEDSSGNTNSTIAIVTVEDNINPIAIGQDITVDLDGNPSVTITADDVNNGSSDNCGSITLGIDVDTFSELGEFPVVLSVEDANGNLVTVVVTVTVIDSFLSVDDNTIENNSIKIHPNPAKNVLYFETKNTISSFNIIDVTGKIVLKQQNPNNEIKVDQLSHGVYFIRFITDGGQSIVKRFVKK